MLGLKQTRELKRWALGRNPAFGMPLLEPVDALGLKVMSVGFLLAERQAFELPAPLLSSVTRQLIAGVDWGDLDVLVVDLPPGTGDAPLTLVQQVPLAGGVIVTTPQDVALLDVRKAIGMFQRLNVPILGVVENMSTFACPHCGQHTNIFGESGGQRVADEYGAPLLARLPLDPETRVGGDEGTPITVRKPDSAQALAFRNLAAAVMRRIDELGALGSLPKIS
jgi:ATP-binding protein involved in chromosome partitioning